MVVIIRRLIWEPKNIRHIARHNISVDEVEETIRNFYIPKPAPKKRLILVGETSTGRILEVVLASKGEGRFYPITAYDANSDMVAMIKRKKGVNKQ